MKQEFEACCHRHAEDVAVNAAIGMIGILEAGRVAEATPDVSGSELLQKLERHIGNAAG